jgi:hypothetical protein
MASIPSKQKDTIFKAPHNPPFKQMGAVVNNGEIGMGEPTASMGKIAPSQKDKASHNGSASLIHKHMSPNQGTRAPWKTTAKAPEEVQVNGGCKDQEPDTQAQSASIVPAGHFQANH